MLTDKPYSRGRSTVAKSNCQMLCRNPEFSSYSFVRFVPYRRDLITTVGRLVRQTERCSASSRRTRSRAARRTRSAAATASARASRGPYRSRRTATRNCRHPTGWPCARCRSCRCCPARAENSVFSVTAGLVVSVYSVSSQPKFGVQQQVVGGREGQLELPAVRIRGRRVLQDELGDLLAGLAVSDRREQLDVVPVRVEVSRVEAQPAIEQVGADADLRVLDQLGVVLRLDGSQAVRVNRETARVEALRVAEVQHDVVRELPAAGQAVRVLVEADFADGGRDQDALVEVARRKLHVRARRLGRRHTRQRRRRRRRTGIAATSGRASGSRSSRRSSRSRRW